MNVDSSAGQQCCEITSNVLKTYEKERSQKIPTRVCVGDVADPAVADGIISSYINGEWTLTAVFEAKTRWAPVTYENLLNDPFYEGRLVMDESKLENCSLVARMMNIEFWSISIFHSEKIYTVQKIKNKWGQSVADYYIKDNKSRKNINTSDKVVKATAFISEKGHIKYSYD